MSAWPEAIYTINKITADLLEKHNSFLENLNGEEAGNEGTITILTSKVDSVTTTLGSVYNVGLQTRFTSIDTAIANLSSHIDDKFDLTQHIVTSSLSNLDTSTFSPDAIAFISDD